MRFIFCGLILFFSIIAVEGQKIAVKATVNEQVELVSIVARLAEYDEFVNNQFKNYATDVDNHFGKHKNHELIQFAKKVRQKGIGFDRVMGMAVHLNPDLTAKVALTEKVPNETWGKKDGLEFVRLLQKFYKDAEAEAFFKKHREMYRTVEGRMQQLVDTVNFAWFQKFYGEAQKSRFNLYIGLLNGGGNFGPKVIYPNKKEDLFAVMGTWQTDDSGLPIFPEDDYLPTVIHEFNHSFINNLVDVNPKPFEASYTQIFKFIVEKMQRRAYGNWQTTLNESLVRAAVTRYLFEHKGIDIANLEIIGEKGNGFVWMDELFVLLGTYENNRQKYPTLRSFMPVLVGYHADLAKRVDHKINSFEAQKPTITAIEQFKNEAQEVDPNIKLITFNFSRPLRGKGISINYGTLGEAGFPELEKGFGFYNDDATKFNLKVKLKPDTNYEFVMTGGSFISKDGYPLQEYVVKFKTKKN
jgi:hypothetical protein